MWSITLAGLVNAQLFIDVDLPQTGVVAAQISHHVRTIMQRAGLIHIEAAELNGPVWMPLDTGTRVIHGDKKPTLCSSIKHAQSMNLRQHAKPFHHITGKLKSPDPSRPLICLGVYKH
jgi:hypothetical protein